MNRSSILLILVTPLLCSCGGASTARQSEHSFFPAEGKKSVLADYVAFPGVGIEVRRPEGFAKADSFDGFGQPETQSSVVMVRVHGPYAEVTAGFTEEKMKAQGWSLLSKQDLKIDGLPGVLVHFEMPARGDVFLKWVVAFGDERKTTMVTANFPKAHAGALSASLKSAVLSTRLHRGDPVEPGTDVPFTLAGSKKLKLTPALSRSLAYTKDGVIPAKSPKDPLFIAAPSIGEFFFGDKLQYAERRLRETAHTKGLVVKSTDAITIAGLDGYESLAEAVHAKSGTPLIVYQVMLFDESSYILMGGIVGAELRDEYLPEFKSMARSLKRKQH